MTDSITQYEDTRLRGATQQDPTNMVDDTFSSIIAAMLKNPPDPNEPVPFSNKKSTLYGVTIPFHVRTLTTNKGIV